MLDYIPILDETGGPRPMKKDKYNIISTGFSPIDWQVEAFKNLRRRNVFVIHRRGGKTVFCVNYIIHMANYFDKIDPKTGKKLKNPTYAYIAPTYRQAKEISWEYFLEYCKDLPGFKSNSTELKIYFDCPAGRASISLIGAENYESFRGMKFDGYVLDEASTIPLKKIRDEILMATISDRIGWEIVIGTPQGQNAFKELFMMAQMDADGEWYAKLIPVTDTNMIAKTELLSLQKNMSKEAFEQEYMCNFNAIPSGYYYQSYIEDAIRENRVTKVPYDPSYPVTTYWDMGRDGIAIWYIQEVGREIRCIRYWETTGKGLNVAIQEIESHNYHYSEHFLPHDASNHELQVDTTRVDFLRNNGLRNLTVVPRTKSVAEDLHLVRVVLPKCLFDKDNCKLGLEALIGYRRKYDDVLKVYSDKPVHDKCSHGADSFRQFAVSYQPGFGSMGAIEERNRLPEVADSHYDMFNM